jgi:hypothetical protein
MKQFVNHIEIHNTNEQQLDKMELSILDELCKKNICGLFQCIYCIFGCSTKKKMLHHMMEHPSEFAVACKRESPTQTLMREKMVRNGAKVLETDVLINIFSNSRMTRWNRQCWLTLRSLKK